MDQYKVQKKLGDGTYGQVFRATHISNGQVVAIKKFKKKYTSWEECINLREIKALQKLKHPNIIKLIEVFKEKDELLLVFEFLDRDIYQAYLENKNNGKFLPEDKIRSIIKQTAEGLAHMHKAGYFHRDLKPENLLVHGDTVKICDFGLAREIRSRPPYTEYVATRWYRAPEILLKQNNYNSPVDIFALGCIMAELYTLNPLFNGSSEIDQLFKICQVLGTPTTRDWPDCQKLATAANITFPHCPGTTLDRIVNNCSPEALDLIKDMLRYDPSRRPTARQILEHPYFQQAQQVIPLVQVPIQSHHNYDRLLEDRKPVLELPKIEAKKHETKQAKLSDSSSSFFDQLEQKMAEYDKPVKREEPRREEPKRSSFHRPTQEYKAPLEHKPTFENKPPLDYRHLDHKPYIMDIDKEVPLLEIRKESRKQSNLDKGNPFKLIKYNDPIANSAQQAQFNMPQSHSYEPTGRKVNNANIYNFDLQLPSIPQLKPSLNALKMDSVPPRIKHNNVSNLAQHYPRSLPAYNLGNKQYGNNNKVDEFGFARQQKYSNY